MINFIAGEAGIKTSAFIGNFICLCGNLPCDVEGMGMLPRDQGREFAVDGKSLPVNREEPDFVCPGIYCGGTAFRTGQP